MDIPWCSNPNASQRQQYVEHHSQPYQSSFKQILQIIFIIYLHIFISYQVI